MKITIESTTKIVTVKTSALADGVPCRVWEGVTEHGTKVQCLIPRLAAAGDADGRDLAQFEADLEQHAAPSEDLQMWPMRMIL